jgi:hypothetical protein
MDGQFNMQQTDVAELIAGRMYLSIQTNQNPAGELRGQILAPGALLFTGILAGTNEVPPVTSGATGGTQFILSADQQTLNYEAVISGVIPTVIEFHQGAAGTNGPVLHQLTLNAQGASGQTATNAADVSAILGGNGDVNVRTASYANGELRAQLVQH